jgi:hypothetical protein
MLQGQATGLNCAEKRSPMLANGCSQNNYLGQRHGSFANFSNTRHGMKQFAYQNLNEADLVLCASTVSGGTQSSYQEDVSMLGGFNVGATSPSTTYSGSSTSAAVDPISLIQPNFSISQIGSMKDVWWPENSRTGLRQYQDTYDLAILHDGLSKAPRQQHQQYSDPWTTADVPSNDWSTQATAPITISPKALTLNVPPAPVSSSGSSQGLQLFLSDSSSAFSCREDTPGSAPETLAVVESPTPVHQHRQILPDSLPGSRIVPVLPSNDFSSTKTTQKRAMKSKSERQPCRKSSSLCHSKSDVTPAPSHKVSPTPAKILAPKKIEPKPTNKLTLSHSSSTLPTTQAQHHRDAKDDFLVRSKLAGMSYKDIRRHGNFVEAESTLRGRFRTLTKHKAARVRKPEWTDNDVCTHSSSLRALLISIQVRLLKKAVRKLSNGSDMSKNKVPWKLVAEYIANNGGSYHFGNATCRKRWDDLSAKQRS